jgi:hypothetical protein
VTAFATRTSLCTWCKHRDVTTGTRLLREHSGQPLCDIIRVPALSVAYA